MTIGAVLLGIALVALLIGGDSSLLGASKDAYIKSIELFQQIP